jgi:hypothetical protein
MGSVVASEGDYPWYVRLLFTAVAWLMNAPWVLVLVGAGILVVGVYRLGVRSAPTVPTTDVPQAPSNAPSTPAPSWTIPAGPKTGPIGPILAAQLVQWFNENLPKPCVVKLTFPTDSELGRTFSWLIQYGGGQGLCSIYQDDKRPRNIDDGVPINPTTEPGIVIHWNESFAPGEGITHFFDSSGFNIRISHKMPAQTPPNLIWIDIGPDSPWKDGR